ncbi:MAG: 5'-nucleotidase C-terminal domain-containing protein [Gammaproteobacteria bacterium]|nr:5'-nucleotidase C-terminal domain-containing protein [Gammaproteobacteria bacterium]
MSQDHVNSLQRWLIAAWLLACSSASYSETNTPSVTAPTEPVTITLIHYNDLHAHLTAHADRVPDAKLGEYATNTKLVERGGLARIATLIKRLRAENPNSVLMNIGDTFHGGVEALFTLGNAVVDPVNALGIDIGVPGNWDYAYGPLVTRLRYASLMPAEQRMLGMASDMMMSTMSIKRPNYQNLAANVSYTMPFFKAGKPFLPATWMTQRAGIKLGFIGLSSDIVPQMSPTLAMGLAFLQGEDNYKKLVTQHAQALRAQGAQLVFVMSELGIHKDKRLADLLAPGLVNVFFSAHTHEATFTPLVSASGALVVEAGNDGYVGRMNVTLKSKQTPSFNWLLLPVDNRLPENPAMKTLVDTARAPFLAPHPNIKLPMPYADVTLTQAITTVVGHSKGALDRRQALENTFNRVFADALRQRADTQLAMTPGFRFDSIIGAQGELFEDDTVANGAITLEDVYRFFPVVYSLATAEVSGERLLHIAEQSLTQVYSKNAFKQSGGWFEGFSGLGLKINIAGNDNARIKDAWLTDDQAPIDAQSIYTIAGCQRPDDGAGVLCSYSGFNKVQALINPATGKAWNVADLFIDVLATAPLAAAGKNRFTELSQTPVWPQAPFVQPLWQ